VVSSRLRALQLIAAASAAGLPRYVRAQSLTTLRVGGGTNDTFAEPHYGQEAGIFAKYGLNLEITDFPNSQQQVVAAAGGALDLGMADMIQLAAPIEKGVPLAYFAGGCLYRHDAPQTLLVTARDGPIHAPKDLNGKTVGVVALNSISWMSVTEWLKRGGADVSSIKIFELPFSTMIPGLQRGTVAAAFLAEPSITAGKQSGDIRVVASTYDTIAPSFYIGAWFGPKDWPQKSPDVMKRFTAALYETARWCDTHRDETAISLSKLSKIDLDRVKAMNRGSYATSIDPKLMQPVIDMAVKYNLLAKRVDASTLIMKV
jgi:NitT/TauT family transport system substrate-binding protein